RVRRSGNRGTPTDGRDPCPDAPVDRPSIPTAPLTSRVSGQTRPETKSRSACSIGLCGSDGVARFVVAAILRARGKSARHIERNPGRCAGNRRFRAEDLKPSCASCNRTFGAEHYARGGQATEEATWPG